MLVVAVVEKMMVSSHELQVPSSYNEDLRGVSLRPSVRSSARRTLRPRRRESGER